MLLEFVWLGGFIYKHTRDHLCGSFIRTEICVRLTQPHFEVRGRTMVSGDCVGGLAF